jgi:hypothetical protein
MIETLFLIALTAFAFAALAWFIFWAVWIHANTAAYGPAPSGYAAFLARGATDPAVQRKLTWYRRVRRATLVLLVSTIVLGALALL